MNDQSLRSQLQALIVPAVTAEAAARAKHRALLALNEVRKPILRYEPSGWPWAFSAGSFIVAAMIVAICVFHRPPVENLAADREMVQQMEKLFPGQVDSIVEKDGKIDLSVGDSPGIGRDQPVLVTFTHGAETIRILSYSGHRLCLNLGSQRSCLELLATPNGGVILENGGHAWLASEHPLLNGYRVQRGTLL